MSTKKNWRDDDRAVRSHNDRCIEALDDFVAAAQKLWELDIVDDPMIDAAVSGARKSIARYRADNIAIDKARSKS